MVALEVCSVCVYLLMDVRLVSACTCVCMGVCRNVINQYRNGLGGKEGVSIEQFFNRYIFFHDIFFSLC